MFATSALSTAAIVGATAQTSRTYRLVPRLDNLDPANVKFWVGAKVEQTGGVASRFYYERSADGTTWILGQMEDGETSGPGTFLGGENDATLCRFFRFTVVPGAGASCWAQAYVLTNAPIDWVLVP